MSKLLVLGSNFGAVEIVKRAKERGIYTIVADYYDPSRSNAKKYCDESWEVSITEINQLVEMCRREGVTAVTCGVSEFTSELTFRLCDKLGLPKYCSWDAWAVARNKRRFKDICISHNVPVAKDYYVSDASDSEQIGQIEYPVVVKPVDCGGNVGVSFCHNADELVKAFDNARAVTEHEDAIICEQMLRGGEYVAVYALAQGEARLVSLFSMLCADGFPTNTYSIDVTTSGVLQQYLYEVDCGVRAVLRDAGFTEGIAWVEFMYDGEGFYALETGYRLPGGMLPFTFDAIAGFNAIDWYLDPFLGIQHSPDDLPESQSLEYERYGVSYLLWNSEPGKLSKVGGIDQIEIDDRFSIVDFIRRPGFDLPPYSLMGEIIFVTANRDEAINLISYVNETVSVTIEDGRDVLIRFADFDKVP